MNTLIKFLEVILERTFPSLNYLEQGQNKLLHTRVDERKDALGSLFTSAISLLKLKTVSRLQPRLPGTLETKSAKAKATSLEAERTTLREILQADLGSVEYKKLSTIESEPSWDKAVPFLIYDQESYTQFLGSIHKLNDLTSSESGYSHPS